MVRNIGLTSVANVYRALLQLLLNVVLVAYLTPADFGLVALLLPLTLLAVMIGDMGLATAIVRSRSLEPKDAGAAALFNAGFAAVVAAAAIAAYAGGLMDGWTPPMPELTLAFAGALGFALGAVVPRALLERRLRYGAIAAAETGAATAAIGVAVAVAAAGGGAWSLAVFHLAQHGLRFALFTSQTRDGIRPTRQWRRALPLIGFGGWLLASNLVGLLARHADNYIVGGLLGTAALGAYAFAYQVMLVPLMTVSWPMSGVLTATLSRVAGDEATVRRAFLAALRLAAVLLLPAMAFLGWRAEALVPAFFPERWSSLGPVLGPLALSGGVQAVSAFCGVLFVVCGRPRLQLTVAAANTAGLLATIAAAAALTGDLRATAFAYLGANIVSAAAIAAVLSRLIGGAGRAFAVVGATGAAGCLGGAAGLAVAGVLVPAGLAPAIAVVIDAAAYGMGWLSVVAALVRPLLSDVRTLQAAGQQAAAADRALEQAAARQAA